MAYDQLADMDDYFEYARGSYTRFLQRKLKGVHLEEVKCKEEGCRYMPRHDCEDPRRAYRQHMRKYHPERWLYMKKPDFVIPEQQFIEDVWEFPEEAIHA